MKAQGLVLALAGLCLAGPVLAQEGESFPPKDNPDAPFAAQKGGEGAPEEAGEGQPEATITVTAEDCARLVEHVPAPDVAYVPGVDVHGNPVAGPDVNDTSALLGAIPETFELNLAFTPSGLPASLGNSDIPVGTVKYDINSGKLTYNGVALGDAEAQAMAKACREAGFR